MRAKPWDVPDGLWERIEPLLPRRQRRFRYPGRKPFDESTVAVPPVASRVSILWQSGSLVAAFGRF